MGNEKFSNLLIVTVLILIFVGIPYLLYTIGSFIETDYFGYLNNWWLVLLFIFLLISFFILGGIDIEKNLSKFFLMFFTIPFFILGMKLGVKPAFDLENYALLTDKEKKIDRLDSMLLSLENELRQLKNRNFQNTGMKNHEIIFFDPGSSKLSDFNKLRIKSFISDLENCDLDIKGYTDGTGDRASNMDISNERAQKVADFIKSMTTQNNSINTVTGFGDDYQLVENKNEISRSKNRRVTIEIVGKNVMKKKALKEKINKNRISKKDIKEERDSLRKILFKNIKEG